MTNREYALLAGKVLSDKKGQDIVIIDIQEKATFADYFVLCSGTSERQIQTLTDLSLIHIFSYYNEENKQDTKSDESILENIKTQEARRQKSGLRQKESPGVIVKGCLLYTSRCV